MDNERDHNAVLEGFQSLPVQSLLNTADNHFLCGVDGLIGDAQTVPLLQVVDASAENIVDLSRLPQFVSPLGDVGVIIDLLLKEEGQLILRQVLRQVQIVILRGHKVQVQPT